MKGITGMRKITNRRIRKMVKQALRNGQIPGKAIYGWSNAVSIQK